MKRLFDVAFSAAGLVMLAPLFPLIALAIRLEGPGPILFRQRRVGRHLQPFTLYKFRTMVVGAESQGPGITPTQDARVTPVGRFLRGAKLDELPQLYNVLKGDMSLVGPRPELPQYVRLFLDDFREILQVRPGITDPASIAYRNEGALLAHDVDPETRYVQAILPDKIRLAREYVARSSVAFDLRLIFETLFALAYPARPMDALFGRLNRFHSAVALAVQMVLAAAAFAGAWWLRFDGDPPLRMAQLAFGTLPLLLAVRSFWFLRLRLDRDLWRYVGLRELGAITSAVALGTVSFWLLHWPAGAAGIPLSIFALDAILCVAALSGVRVLRRAHRRLARRGDRTTRVLVVAGRDSAEEALRGLIENPDRGRSAIGVVDTDEAHTGLRMHGVPFLGGVDRLEEILRLAQPDEVLVDPAAVAEDRLPEVLRLCRATRRPVRTLGPGIEANGHRNGAAQRNGNGHRPASPPLDSSDDLLFRDPVPVDRERMESLFRGRRVLVTGAGGSIGSEVCRQIASYAPERLVLLESHEASLYHIERELRARWPEAALVPAIADIRDRTRVEEVFAAWRPEVVFHAAAYKHIPMLEGNPAEGIKTNVHGTRVVAETAGRFGAEAFVLISTDKAVDPVCVLGVTKRMAEITVQGMNAGSETRYMTVRFGNVLESSGSVVPLFREQIENGQPVTVTHPDVTRWFMTVSEAVHLILEVSALGRGGEVFVLDMGRPVRIVDLAKALIRRHGLRPDLDVPIVFTGLRPGERLFEKLFSDHEQTWKTAHPRILMARRNDAGPEARREEYERLERFLAQRIAADASRDGARAGVAPEPICA